MNRCGPCAEKRQCVKTRPKLDIHVTSVRNQMPDEMSPDPTPKNGSTMIKRYSGKLLFISLLVLAFNGCSPEQSAEPVAPKLAPKIQDLLRKEMVSINDASQEIFAALIAGDDERVALLAQQIHDSFILEQSMTAEDKAHLMAVAPKGFLEMDKNFHEISAALARAASAGNKPLQQLQFGRMIEACTSCHAQYATDQFPKFVN